MHCVTMHTHTMCNNQLMERQLKDVERQLKDVEIKLLKDVGIILRDRSNLKDRYLPD